jgi:hypothetical protein
MMTLTAEFKRKLHLRPWLQQRYLNYVQKC